MSAKATDGTGRGASIYRRFSEDEKAEMLRLRAAGKFASQIAQAIGVTRTRVADWLRRERRPKTADAEAPPVRWQPPVGPPRGPDIFADACFADDPAAARPDLGSVRLPDSQRQSFTGSSAAMAVRG